MSTVAHKEKLAQHHKLANQYYQQGNYPAALYELGLALAYATHPEDKNIIQSNIGTIRAMMKQDPNSFEGADVSTVAPATSSGNRLTFQNLKHNRLAMTAITIAVLCLTPIAIKFVQIVTGGNAPEASQTAVESTAPVGEAATAATTEEAAGNIIVVESPVAPATTTTTEAPVILSEQTTPATAIPVNTAPAAATSTAKYIAGTKVNLREQASTSANTLIRLQKDTAVTVIDPNPVSADGYTWVKIQTPEGVVGFVASSFLRDGAAVATTATAATTTTTPAATATATTPTDATAVATTGSAKIIGTGVSFRTQPSTQGPLITTLSADNAFTVLESKSVTADGYSWTKIRTAQGTVGWVASQFISP